MTRSASINIQSADNGYTVTGAGKLLVTNSEKDIAGLVSEILKDLMKLPPPQGIAEPKPAQQK